MPPAAYTTQIVLQTIKRSDIEPAPAVAVIPLGTGNDLSRAFGWGGAFSKAWIKGACCLLCILPAPLPGMHGLQLTRA